MPSAQVITPQWAGSIANHYFCSDMTKPMSYWKPRAWLFGHTHDQVDQMVGAARLVCHPRGYPDEFPGQADRDVSRYLPKVIEI